MWSEFEDINGNYIPTAWDNQHLLSMTATRSFKGNWDFGFKFRLAGGAPYTPDNVEKSSIVTAWKVNQRAYPDYTKFNTERLNIFTQLDVITSYSIHYTKLYDLELNNRHVLCILQYFQG